MSKSDLGNGFLGMNGLGLALSFAIVAGAASCSYSESKKNSLAESTFDCDVSVQGNKATLTHCQPRQR